MLTLASLKTTANLTGFLGKFKKKKKCFLLFLNNHPK